MHNNNNPRWTSEQDAELRAHIDAGLSALQTAIRMNRTKGSVMGRAYRLKIRFNGTAAPFVRAPADGQVFWSPKEDAALRDGVARKHSAQEIGQKLNRTRNAVQARARALGLRFLSRTRDTEGRNKAKAAQDRCLRQKLTAAKPAAAVLPPPVDVFRPVCEAVPVEFLLLRRGQCRCAVDGLHGPLRLFCGRPVRTGSSYCPEHAVLLSAPPVREIYIHDHLYR